MNDELVYALIALALHWGLGWRAAQRTRQHAGREWCIEDEIATILAVFFFGIFYWLAVKMYTHYQTIGSLFGKEEK